MLVEYTVQLPEPYPSQKRYLLPNQDYGAFNAIQLENPEIEVVQIDIPKDDPATEVSVTLRSSAVAAHVMIETDKAGYWSDNAFMLVPDTDVTVTFFGYKNIDLTNFKKTLTVMSLWDTYNSVVC